VRRFRGEVSRVFIHAALLSLRQKRQYRILLFERGNRRPNRL
jgi:hypothetical protein